MKSNWTYGTFDSKGYPPLRGLHRINWRLFPGFAGAHRGLYAIVRSADSFRSCGFRLKAVLQTHLFHSFPAATDHLVYAAGFIASRFRQRLTQGCLTLLFIGSGTVVWRMTG